MSSIKMVGLLPVSQTPGLGVVVKLEMLHAARTPTDAPQPRVNGLAREIPRLNYL